MKGNARLGDLVTDEAPDHRYSKGVGNAKDRKQKLKRRFGTWNKTTQSTACR